MRRHFLLAAAAGSLTFASLQVAPVKMDANQPGHSGRTVESTLEVPVSVEAILNSACKNCHSNETRWPWYTKLAPVSWIVADEVERGRRALNFSEWPSQGLAKPTIAIRRLTASCADAESRRMPPPAYGRLQPEQVEALCDWTGDQTRLLRIESMRFRASAGN